MRLEISIHMNNSAFEERDELLEVFKRLYDQWLRDWPQYREGVQYHAQDTNGNTVAHATVFLEEDIG